MRLLVTRPPHQAAATVAALQEDGHECLVSPVLIRHDLDLPQPSGTFEIIVLTSRNAVDGLARQWPVDGREKLAVYTVGDATRDAAVSSGFLDAVSCDGTASDLVEKVAASCESGAALKSPGKPKILYPCALQPAHDLPAMFAARDLKCAAWPVYVMDEVEEFSSEVSQALKEGTLDGVLLYSARSARVFADLVSKQGGLRRPISLFALSSAICAVLPPELAESCKVTKEPNESAMRLLLSQYKA